MPTDVVQRKFVSSFLVFLKKQVELQSLTPDAQESLEVAVQCLEAAFDLGEGGEEDAQDTTNETAGVGTSKPINDPELDLFELFQSMYIERNPKSIEMAENIKNEGNRLMKDGKFNEALLQYNRAINFDPKNPIFYCNRAAAYIRLGDNEHAVTDCKSALLYKPDYGKAYGRLGIAYSNLGKYDEAQQAYAKAIELEPENQDYRNNLEVARNARNQLPQNAIPQLREGLDAMLSNPAIRDLFGNSEINVDRLQQMSQDPIIMGAIAQMFSGMQGSGGGGTIGPGMRMAPDMLQLFQSLASQLGNVSNDGTQPRNGSGDPSNQQPPSSS